MMCNLHKQSERRYIQGSPMLTALGPYSEDEDLFTQNAVPQSRQIFVNFKGYNDFVVGVVL